MRQAKDIPIYKLYGEEGHWPTPDMVHCESIAARSQLHNWQIKPHQHHGLFQILYLRSGTAQIRLDDQHRRLSAGQVLTVPQMCVHGFGFSRNAGGFVVTLAYPLLDRVGLPPGSVAALGSPHVHRLGVDEESRHIQHAFNLIDKEYKGKAPYRNLAIESLLGAILVWLARNASPGQEPLVVSGDRHFAVFYKLLEENFIHQQPVSWYARKIGITAAHLNVLCRHAVNQSALQLIHERVLLEARRNLIYTSMTVSVVSHMLGFSDPAYFTRFFKRRTGSAPKAFRMQAKAIVERAG
jgi:AraC family transcriptional activator of pobA